MFTRNRKKVVSVQGGATLCQRHLKPLTDINNIIARCMRGDTSMLVSCNYVDISEYPKDLQTALNAQIRAASAFDALPGIVKNRYKNASELLNAIQDPEQRDFLTKNGFFEKTEESISETTNVVSPPTEAASVVPETVAPSIT